MERKNGVYDQMFRWCFSFCLFVATTSLSASAVGPAELTPSEVVERSKEMMIYHPTFKHLTPELAGRLLATFCEELDPLKTYLLKSEVIEWIDPSEKMINGVLASFQDAQFQLFENMLHTMERAIARRKNLEERLDKDDLPKGASIRFNELDWAEDEEDLYQRLRTMRAVQMDAAAHLDSSLFQTAIQRIQKRRSAFEQQRTPKDRVVFSQTAATFIMKAFAEALDSQSAFFTPAEAKQLLIGMQQRLFGIGILLRDDIDGFSVIKLVEGGPADRQKGLALGDKIIAVNNEPVIGLDMLDVVEMIRGEPGSIVALKLIRREDHNGKEASAPVEVKLKRGEVIVKDLRYGTEIMPFDGGVIAYLRLHSFYQDEETSSYADLLASLEKLCHDHPVKGVILDLRCNPGGLLTQAVAVTGLFIEKGVVVSVKDEMGGIVHMRNIASKKAWDGPLIILINRASASASEIVAQALQDWGRGIVVGDDRSFGKGSFQLFTLNVDGVTPPNPRGEYKVTRGRYYTVSGKTPQLIGVQSDIVVPGLLCFAEIGELYSKFPLSADAIQPHFEDSFDDVPLFQRPLLRRLYSMAQQKRTDEWRTVIPELKKRSEERLAKNGSYQKFIEKVKAEKDVLGDDDSQKSTDLQLEEARNILKDLVMLACKEQSSVEQKKAA
jgi:carboxyl-terminal processing protease